MIFAAGFGTRMGEMTKHTPKPLIKVDGKPLIDYALEIAATAQVKNIVVNTHYKHAQMAAHLAPLGVQISHEEAAILETGGGLRLALPLLGPDPVFTMNSDAVWSGANPLTTLAAAWKPDIMDALLLLLPRENAVGHKGKGDFILGSDGRLTRGAGLVYSGAQIIKTDRLRDISSDAFSLNLLWDEMAQSKRLFGTVHNGGWCDVGHPGGIADAQALLKDAENV